MYSRAINSPGVITTVGVLMLYHLHRIINKNEHQTPQIIRAGFPPRKNYSSWYSAVDLRSIDLYEIFFSYSEVASMRLLLLYILLFFGNVSQASIDFCAAATMVIFFFCLLVTDALTS